MGCQLSKEKLEKILYKIKENLEKNFFINHRFFRATGFYTDITTGSEEVAFTLSAEIPYKFLFSSKNQDAYYNNLYDFKFYVFLNYITKNICFFFEGESENDNFDFCVEKSGKKIFYFDIKIKQGLNSEYLEYQDGDREKNYWYIVPDKLYKVYIYSYLKNFLKEAEKYGLLSLYDVVYKINELNYGITIKTGTQKEQLRYSYPLEFNLNLF